MGDPPPPPPMMQEHASRRKPKHCAKAFVEYSVPSPSLRTSVAFANSKGTANYWKPFVSRMICTAR